MQYHRMPTAADLSHASFDYALLLHAIHSGQFVLHVHPDQADSAKALLASMDGNFTVHLDNTLDPGYWALEHNEVIVWSEGVK